MTMPLLWVLVCRVTCGPMQPFSCRQKCMELGVNPTDALELPTPATCPYERKCADRSPVLLHQQA